MSSKRCYFHPAVQSPLFGLPMDVVLRNQWLQFMFNSVPENYNPHVKLCAAHFTEDSFLNLSQFNAGFAQRLFLKDGAVPSLSGEGVVCGPQPSSAQEAVGDMEKACSDLTDSIKAQCSEMIHLIRAQEETAVSQAEKVQEQLQQELSELQQRDANIQMLLSSEDDFLILQSFRSLSNPQKCENSPINMSCDGLFGQVRKSISDRKDKMMDLLEENRILLSEEVQKVHIFKPLHPKNREEFLEYSCKLTLDLKTAHNNLHFSEGNTKLTWGVVQSNPDHPERFDSWWQVLNKEGLTGRWYWEVECSGTVIIAVSYKSIVTKGPGIECGFGRNDQSWCLCCTSSQYTFWHDNIETKELKTPSSSRVGVYLDHSAGTLSFYNISDTVSLIYRVKTSFTQPVYPGFGFRLGFLGSVQISPIV